MDLIGEFLDKGCLHFPADAGLAAWAAHARSHATAAASDPANASWLRCGGTWFVGVDALPNDAAGRLPGGPPLDGEAIAFLREVLGFSLPLHRAQASICYPGYPQPSPEESETAYTFRRRRDAAHVDGLHGVGPDKRRHLKEPHAYILGITLTEQPATASPLVVWPGSHRTMAEAFIKVFGSHPPESWGEIDVTIPYQEARRRVFETCARTEIATRPGEAVLMHRHLLHGVAPWGEGATAGADGRIIAYFRPEFANLGDWLDRSLAAAP